MAFNVFVSETLRGLSVRDDFMRVFCGDLREFLFANLVAGDVVVVSVGDAVPGEILPFPIDMRTNRVFFLDSCLQKSKCSLFYICSTKMNIGLEKK